MQDYAEVVQEHAEGVHVFAPRWHQIPAPGGPKNELKCHSSAYLMSFYHKCHWRIPLKQCIVVQQYTVVLTTVYCVTYNSVHWYLQ